MIEVGAGLRLGGLDWQFSLGWQRLGRELFREDLHCFGARTGRRFAVGFHCRWQRLTLLGEPAGESQELVIDLTSPLIDDSALSLQLNLHLPVGGVGGGSSQPFFTSSSHGMLLQ